MLAQPGILWPFQNICKLWLSRLRTKLIFQNRNFNVIIYRPPAELFSVVKVEPGGMKWTWNSSAPLFASVHVQCL